MIKVLFFYNIRYLGIKKPFLFKFDTYIIKSSEVARINYF